MTNKSALILAAELLKIKAVKFLVQYVLLKCNKILYPPTRYFVLL